MHRRDLKGAVRQGETERERDSKMLALYESGLTYRVIAERMGVSAVSVRQRVKRAAAVRSLSGDSTTVAE